MLPRTGISQDNPLFASVYQFAKENNKTALLDLVNQGHSLDNFYFNITPIMKLAEDGNHDAVDLLLNEFNVSKSHAVRGYATAGNVDKVNTFLKEGASVNAAVFGYMLGNHEDAGFALLDKGASLERAAHASAICGGKSMLDRLTAITGIEFNELSGYARGGHDHELEKKQNNLHEMSGILYGYAMRRDIDKVETWLTHLDKFKHYYNDYANAINQAAQAFAIQGFTGPIMDALLQKGASLEKIVHGYSEGGYTKEADSFLDKVQSLAEQAYHSFHPDLPAEVRAIPSKLKSFYYKTYEKCLNEAVYMSAYVGDKKRVEMLLKKGALIDKAIEGYAYGGHEQDVDSILKWLPQLEHLNSAAKGYASGNFYHLIEKMLLRGADAKFALPLSFHCTEKKHMLRVLAFFNDAECRKKLFDAARDHQVNMFPFSIWPEMIKFINEEYDKLTPLLNHADKINTIMRESGCGYTVALRCTQVQVKNTDDILGDNDDSNEDREEKSASVSEKVETDKDNKSSLQTNSIFAINTPVETQSAITSENGNTPNNLSVQPKM